MDNYNQVIFNTVMNAICLISGSVLVGYGTNWKVGLGAFLLALFIGSNR